MDTLKLNQSLHFASLGVLFILAVIAFWPVLNKVDSPEKHMNYLFKTLYVFGIGGLLLPACAMIIFTETPMFKTYTESAAWLKSMELCVPAGVLDSLKDQNMISGPEYFSNMSPLSDQRTGGVIMKILQEVFFGFIIAYLFIKWWNQESKDPDEVTRRSLEAANERKKMEELYR